MDINKKDFWRVLDNLLSEEDKKQIWQKLAQNASIATISQHDFWQATEGLLSEVTKADVWSELHNTSQISSTDTPDQQETKNEHKKQNKIHPILEYISISYILSGLLILWGLFFITQKGLTQGEYRGGYLALITALYAVAFMIGSWVLMKKGKYKRTAGTLALIALGMIPLCIYGLQDHFGQWPGPEPVLHQFLLWPTTNNLIIELGTLSFGIVAILLIRFPLLALPISFVFDCFVYDLICIFLDERTGLGYIQSLWVQIFANIIILAMTCILDYKAKNDYAFWGYIYSVITGWLILYNIYFVYNSYPYEQGGMFIYLLANILIIFTGLFLRRNVFNIGFLGVVIYLGQLILFVKNNELFPLVATLLGFLIFGVTYFLNQKLRENKNYLCKFAFPSKLKDLRPRKHHNEI